MCRYQSVLLCCSPGLPHKLFLARVHSLSFHPTAFPSQSSLTSPVLFWGVLTLSFLVLFKQIANTINVLLSHGPSIIISSFFLFIFFPSFSHFVPPPLSLIPSVVQRLGKLAHVAFCLARSSRIWLHIDLTSNPADPDQVSL